MTGKTTNQIQTTDHESAVPVQTSVDETTRKMMIAVMNKKSMCLGIVLTILFSGPGVFYASIPGGLTMTFLEIIGFFVTLLTFGYGIIFLIPLHIAALIWTVLAISNHNRKLTELIM